MSLGTNIAALRARAGMSQDALAEKLEVSRQSVSKWETDVSVPELEKLVRLTEIFGVSLDELILDKKPKPAPAPPEPAPSQPSPAAPSAGARTMTGAKLAGTIILAADGAATLLGLLLVGADTLFLTLPLCVPGILCLACKKRPALWAVWSLVLMVEVYLAAAVGVSARDIISYLLHPDLLEIMPAGAALTALLLLCGNVPMVLWTVLSFWRTPLPRNAKTVVLAACLWILYLAVLPWLSRLAVHRLTLLPSVTYQEYHRAEVLTDLFNVLSSLTSLPLFTAAVTVTALLLKRRRPKTAE